MNAKERKRLSNVRTLWACQCHPYIESTDSLIHVHVVHCLNLHVHVHVHSCELISLTLNCVLWWCIIYPKQVWDLATDNMNWVGATCRVTMVGHMHTVRCLQVCLSHEAIHIQCGIMCT